MTIRASCWHATSMVRAGRLTPWPILTRHGRRVCPPFWSGPDPATAAMYGCSLQTPCQPVRPDAVGVFLVREAMTVRAELDLSSYDRLFPAQDFLPRQGFGNLIGLPLQGECRRGGTTVFLDPANLEPYGDQWEFLSSLAPMSAQAVTALADSVGDLAVGPVSRTYRRPAQSKTHRLPPNPIRASAGASLSIDNIGLSTDLVAALKHAASLANPEFYEKERNRFWTGKTPRLIRCYREELGLLHLPRGLRPQAEAIAAEVGTRLEITDRLPDVEEVIFRPGRGVTP